MAWIIGVDEAGYGPNLGPLTMTAVAFRIPEELAGANLWDVLRAVVCKAGIDDGRLVVDDSKQVYDRTSGIGALELGVLATLWRGPLSAEANLGHFLSATCNDSIDDLRGEAWHKGDDRLVAQVEAATLTTATERFDCECAAVGLTQWVVRGVVVPAPRFNVLAEEADSKGAVLAHALSRLLATKLVSLGLATSGCSSSSTSMAAAIAMRLSFNTLCPTVWSWPRRKVACAARTA